MRDIKYQYWDFKNKKMSIMGDNGVLRTAYKSESNGVWQDCSLGLLVMRHHGGKGVLREYTGLKDKTGKEIYSGDILDLHSTVNGVNLFEVYYNESQARFSIKYYTNLMPKRSLEYEYSVSHFFKPCEFSGEVDFEVIGNIFENKNLLETEK